MFILLYLKRKTDIRTIRKDTCCLFLVRDLSKIINLDLTRENFDNLCQLKCQRLTSNKAVNTRLNQ